MAFVYGRCITSHLSDIQNLPLRALDGGEPEYKFDAPLSVGDKVIFEDQIHYTIVKNTTFNGIKLPDLLLLKENGELVTVREFGFEEYERRN